MSRINALISLLTKSSDSLRWLKPILAELNKTIFKEVESMPQKGVVKDISRVLCIHLESVIAANITTMGLNETIKLFENIPPETPIWSYGFSSEKSSLLVYSDSDFTSLVGCVLIFRKGESEMSNLKFDSDNTI